MGGERTTDKEDEGKRREMKGKYKEGNGSILTGTSIMR
jgi:hypothetical protein